MGAQGSKIKEQATQAAIAAQKSAQQLPGAIDNAAVLLNQTAVSANNLAAAAQNAQGVAQGALGVYGAAQEWVGESSGGTCGGGELGYFDGGDEDPSLSLSTYGESRAAKTKERVSRANLAALNKLGVAVDSSASDEVIAKTLAAKLPNPKKNGDTFKADAEAQKTI